MIWMVGATTSRSAESTSSHTVLRTVEEKPQSRPQTRARAPSGRPGSKFAPPKRNPRDSASTAGYCLSDPGERRPLRAPSTIRDAVASEATSMGVIKLSSEIKPTLENTDPIAVK